jgi:hypothetical protein
MRLFGVLLLSFALSCGPSVPGNPGTDGDTDRPDSHVGPTIDADTSCVEATYSGEQAPAAFLVLLDRSKSMGDNNKWTYAAQAIVAALDQDVFDSMYVALYAAPSGPVTGPPCIGGFEVPCAVPPFPQVDFDVAGTNKSSAATGVRRRIKDWLTSNTPGGGPLDPDASPMYDAIFAASGALQFWTPPSGGANAKRAMMIVTDGSISCTSLSSPPRPAYPDGNGCLDWENPQNLINMLQANNTDPDRPIDSYVVGVPGADTYDVSGYNFPPYHMRLALSAIAYAGAPTHAPAGCTGTSYVQAGDDPAVPCHFDMTVPGGFSATALADKISYIRSETLGCIFEMPEPPPGQTIDQGQVNVSYTFDGVTVNLFRRSDPSNPCTATGCWDYTPDNRIELIGQACADITNASSVQVSITTGCITIVG